MDEDHEFDLVSKQPRRTIFDDDAPVSMRVC